MAEADIANKNLDLDNTSSTPRYLIITYIAEADTLAGLAVGTVSVGSFDVTNQNFFVDITSPTFAGCATCDLSVPEADGATKLMGAAVALAVAATL